MELPWDFFVARPRKGKHVTWVVLDKLSEVSHFIPMHTRDSCKSELILIFLQDIVQLHGVPKSIDLVRGC
jgi:hypothetical protein